MNISTALYFIWENPNLLTIEQDPDLFKKAIIQDEIDYPKDEIPIYLGRRVNHMGTTSRFWRIIIKIELSVRAIFQPARFESGMQRFVKARWQAVLQHIRMEDFRELRAKIRAYEEESTANQGLIDDGALRKVRINQLLLTKKLAIASLEDEMKKMSEDQGSSQPEKVSKLPRLSVGDAKQMLNSVSQKVKKTLRPDRGSTDSSEDVLGEKQKLLEQLLKDEETLKQDKNLVDVEMAFLAKRQSANEEKIRKLKAVAAQYHSTLPNVIQKNFNPAESPSKRFSRVRTRKDLLKQTMSDAPKFTPVEDTIQVEGSASTPESRMLEDFESELSPSLMQLWQVLMENLGRQLGVSAIEQWCFDTKTCRFTLKLKQQCKLGICTEDDKNGKSDTPGGVVLIFEEIIEGNLITLERKLDIEKGIFSYCKHKTFGAVKPQIFSIQEVEDEKISIAAGYNMKWVGRKSQAETKPLNLLLQQWSTSPLVEDEVKFVKRS